MNLSPAIDRPQRYLLVDDHPAFRRTVKDFLSGNPIDVFECSDGGEAVEAYTHHQPDWTLMDVQLPGMDGLTATRSIRTRDPHARIIILTEHDSPELREQARVSGAVAYVLKDRLRDLPVVLSTLLSHPCSGHNLKSSS